MSGQSAKYAHKSRGPCGFSRATPMVDSTPNSKQAAHPHMRMMAAAGPSHSPRRAGQTRPYRPQGRGPRKKTPSKASPTRYEPCMLAHTIRQRGKEHQGAPDKTGRLRASSRQAKNSSPDDLRPLHPREKQQIEDDAGAGQRHGTRQTPIRQQQRRCNANILSSRNVERSTSTPPARRCSSSPPARRSPSWNSK